MLKIPSCVTKSLLNGTFWGMWAGLQVEVIVQELPCKVCPFVFIWYIAGIILFF